MDSELKEILKGIKGLRDFYPENFAEINMILDIMRSTSRKFGYEEYEGPSIEFAKLIEYKSGQELVDETYRLFDRENRKLVLRPEQTPTLARLVVNQHQRYPKPMRWYSIPRIFRDETPQKGRVKEHFQFNADIIGVEHVGADAEIIALTTEIIRTAGLKDDEFVCVINSRELLQGYIEYLKISDYLGVIKIIDSRGKYLQNQLQKNLENQGVNKDKANEIATQLRQIWRQDPEIKKEYPELQKDKKVSQILDELNSIEEKCVIDAFSSIGL
ncbi:MAG: ATP phosphoribosyltransferase regulatory subunit, partial [Candidatus Heimdallarchaeaceae archaeon]